MLPSGGASTPHLTSPDATVDYCSGCGWCTTVCPADVKIAEMNNRARASMKAGHRPRHPDWLLGQTHLVRRLGGLTAPIANVSPHHPRFPRLIDLLDRSPRR